MNELVEVLHAKQLSRLLEAARRVIAEWEASPMGQFETKDQLYWAVCQLRSEYDDCRATMAGHRTADPPVTGPKLADYLPQGMGDKVTP